MVFEWYSGSDSTGRVPKLIFELSLHSEQWEEGAQLGAFQELLNQEEDRNWRGYLLYYLAQQFHLAGDEDSARSTLHDAVEEFDLFARNFSDVELQYANSLYHLVKAVYWETDDTDTLVEYALRILPHQAILSGGPEGKDLFEIMSIVGEAVFGKATDEDDKAYYRIALDFFQRAHHLEPEDPNTIARIVYAQYGAGNETEARRAFLEYEKLEEVTGQRYKHEQHLREFMYTAFPDLLENAAASYCRETSVPGETK